jgi:Response regulators consisting of a CheY-like receiver domain and a winged-helix DNA-binding domain
MCRVLVIEDDELIAELERDFLLASNFEVEIANSGAIGLQMAKAYDYVAILLDLMLPEKDGITICREIRKVSNVPIIMVTAKKEDMDKIRGLSVGADDYIIKPFSPTELVARVRAHINVHQRLYLEFGKADNIEESICIKNLKILPKARRIFKDEKEISLTNKEFELLLFFIDNPNVVLSKDIIFDRIWGMDAIGDTATVTVHVNRLREKIETNLSNPVILQTVWGAGYRFCIE